MVFGLLFVFLIYIICFLASFLFIKFRRKEKFDLNNHKEIIADFLLSLLFSVVLFIFITVYVGKISVLNSLYIAFFMSLAGFIFSPYRLFVKHEFNSLNIRRVIFGIIILVFSSVECFSNNKASFKSNSHEEKEIGIEELHSGHEFTQNDYFVLHNNDGYTYIKLNFDEDCHTGCYVSYYIQSKEGEDFWYYRYFDVSSDDDTSTILRLPNFSYYALRVQFYTEDSRYNYEYVSLSSITLDYNIPFSFNLFRVLLYSALAGIVLFLYDFIKRMNFKNTSLINKIELSIMGIAVITLVIFNIYAFINKNDYFLTYPFENVEKSDIYMQLFDAFMKKQFHLDLNVSEKLLSLDNPYDNTARKGISYFWDHAYYNGKYYCYYGPAPIILITFPIYFLTKLVTNVLYLEIVATIILTNAIMLVILEMVKLFVKNINYPILIVLLVSSVFLSLSLLNTTYKEGYYEEAIYHIPEAYGIMFSMLYLFFTLKGYSNKKYRGLLFFVSGVMFVFLMASRPNQIFIVLPMLPLYFKLLFGKDEKWGGKIKDFLPMFVILFIGAALLCYYNYKRFGSIIEFGQKYQLTVIDNTSLKFHFSSLWPSFFHFYVEPYVFDKSFPFVEVAYEKLSVENHTYIQGTAGILFIPFFDLALLGFNTFHKESIEKKSVFYMLLLEPYLICLLTYCYAGTCIRYMLDFYPIITVTSILVVMMFISKYKDNKIALNIFIPVMTVFLLFSLFITFNLWFNGFDGIKVSDVNGIYTRLKEFFKVYNYK